jgi:hypothetical protein
MSNSYYTAAVCRRGHVESWIADTKDSIPPKCDRCGATILMTCLACGKRVRGAMREGMFFTDEAPPEFCDFCGSPHPWASRQARFYQLENLLDEEDLEEADRLKVQEQLELLQREDDDEETAIERWSVIQRLAPGVVATGSRIIETIVTATVKAHLGLP